MRLTIFSRLMAGYLTVFVLVTAVSGHVIIKFYQFNAEVLHILKVDHLMLDEEKKLTDSILSQMRYERKYLITKDGTFYQQFLSGKGDFDKYLAEALSIADTPPKRDSLVKIRTGYGRYNSLIDEEIARVKTNQNYSRKWFKQEKEKVATEILGELERLEAYSQAAIRNRMKTLNKFVASARTVAIVMSIVAITLVIATSFFFTRSITKPLKLLMNKTKEVSIGVFKCDLNISSPPEISELTKAFNLMCDKLNDVDKMKSDFFSSMSHELRTPLTSIKEGINLLREGVGGMISDKQKGLLSILTVETNRLINLVNSLLDLSKMKEGKMTYNFGQGILAPLIERAIMEIGPLAEAKKIHLETEISEGIPLLKMDSERILQVLRNLVGNAIKFTTEGGQLKVIAQLTNSGVEVSVADTGPGIPNENLTAIFEKFHQVPVKSSNRIKGTGLGLDIVKHIIIAHGGRVWVESQPGQGSAFIFVLPA